MQRKNISSGFPNSAEVCDTPQQFERPTRVTLDPMTTARFLIAALAGLVCTPTFAQAALGLTFNGEVVVPVGQLEIFSYNPSSRSVRIETFFGDLRCMPGEQSGEGTPITVVIDQESDLEQELASYEIFSGGAVEYQLSNGMINVATADTAENQGCVHAFEAVGVILDGGEADPGTFWSSDFSSPLQVTGTTISPAVIGTTLTIEFAVDNISKLLVATDIEVDLDLPDLSALGITGPTFSDPDRVNAEGMWAILSLWPDDPKATIEVSYEIPDDPDLVGEEIRTDVIDVRANDRTRLATLAISDIGISVVNTTTAP